MGEGVAVSRVALYNRRDDCCMSWLSNSVISLINNQGRILATWNIGDTTNIPFLQVTFNGSNGALVPDSCSSHNHKCPSIMATENCQAILHENGNFILYDSVNNIVWSSSSQGQGTPPYSLHLESDGNLVMYDGLGGDQSIAIWDTGTGGIGTGPYSAKISELYGSCDLLIDDTIGRVLWVNPKKDHCFKDAADNGNGIERNGPLYKAVNAYISQNCTTNPNCEVRMRFGDIGTWCTKDITIMEYLFWDYSTFNQPLNGWNVGKVTKMNYMFARASSFNQPLDGWDVSNVVDMTLMFDNAASFNQPLSGWNVGKVMQFLYMFGEASKFNQDLCQWGNTSKSNYFRFDGAGLFVNTGCAYQDSPTWKNKGPFCASDCSVLSGSPSISPTLSMKPSSSENPSSSQSPSQIPSTSQSPSKLQLFQR